jgi:hypothetical protein
MTSQHCPFVVTAVGSLYSIGFAAAAWAHHPMPRPDTSSGSAWSLLWFLGAGVCGHFRGHAAAGSRFLSAANERIQYATTGTRS